MKENKKVDAYFEIGMKQAVNPTEFDRLEQLAKKQEHQMTEQELDRLTKIYRHTQSQKRAMRYSLRVAAVAAVVLIVTTGTLFTSEAFRIRFFNFFIREQPTHAELNLGKPSAYNDLSLGNYRVEYVPDGYTLTGQSDRFLQFQKDQAILTIQIYDVDANFLLDNENLDDSTTVTINGQKGLITTKTVDGTCYRTLVFNTEDAGIGIYAEISKDEMLTIARNIIKQ